MVAANLRHAFNYPKLFEVSLSDFLGPRLDRLARPAPDDDTSYTRSTSESGSGPKQSNTMPSQKVQITRGENELALTFLRDRFSKFVQMVFVVLQHAQVLSVLGELFPMLEP